MCFYHTGGRLARANSHFISTPRMLQQWGPQVTGNERRPQLASCGVETAHDSTSLKRKFLPSFSQRRPFQGPTRPWHPSPPQEAPAGRLHTTAGDFRAGRHLVGFFKPHLKLCKDLGKLRGSRTFSCKGPRREQAQPGGKTLAHPVPGAPAGRWGHWG